MTKHDDRRRLGPLMPTSRWWNRAFATVIAFTIAVAAPLAGTGRQAAAQSATTAESAKTWMAQRAAIEEYLRTAPVGRMEAIGRGVTLPRRAYFEGRGPVDSMVWKPIQPGISRGYYESYKSEIAAYEIDKLLALDMVPPKVERRVQGDVGVAVMWVAPTTTFADHGGLPKPPPAQAPAWNRQIVKAKMFQNLIGDIDPNLGNWLVDPSWNIILVDHSRALTGTDKLVHEMQSIDAALWSRITALTEADLYSALSTWIGKREVRGILERRKKMQSQVDRLVRSKGENQVFVR